MKAIKSILVFSNGNLAVFDSGGQVGELQGNLFCEWADRAKELGYEPDGLTFEVQNGRRWRFFKTDDGYNIEGA